MDKIYFAGDHNAGLHPKVIEALIRVNSGKVASYMEDEEFKKMNDNFCSLLGKKVKTLLFNTGTAANIVAIASMVKPFNSIICPKTAHWQKFVYYLETNDLDIEKYKKYFVFARWVTSWQTTEEEIDSFARAINSL